MKNQGFTLIEILIALAVFTILAAATSTIIYNVSTTRARVLQQNERLESLELALSMFKYDLLQAIDRPITIHKTSAIFAFLGDETSLEFSRGGYVYPHVLRRSALKRVAWYCRDSSLVRRSWERLDVPTRAAYSEKTALANLTSCKLGYLNKNLQTLKEWRGKALDSEQNKEPLPTAVQLHVSLADWGHLSYLFALPNNKHYEYKQI